MTDTIRLSDVRTMEGIIREHASNVAKKYRIRDDIYSLHLVTSLRRGTMCIIPGPCVQIQLLWPDVWPVINDYLRSAFELIKRRRDVVYTPMALTTHAYFRDERRAARRWAREKLGKDIADVVLNLLPRYRLRIDTTVTTRTTDTITGEYVEDTIKSSRPYSSKQLGDDWNELSRIVHERHPETLDNDDDE